MPQPLKDHVRKSLLWRGIAVNRSDELTMLADRFGSDKGNLSDGHGYTRIYTKLFEGFRDREINLIELGLHRAEVDGRREQPSAEGATQASATRAPSLQMWRVYFPQAQLFGFDIDDFSRVSIDRCRTVRGDMSSQADLEKLVQAVGGPIDIAIDDASHASHHQQIALGHLFPHMRSGGIYVIEDLCWQPHDLERAGVPKTRELIRQLQVNRIFESPVITPQQRLGIEENVRDVRLYDSLSYKLGDPSDSLAVLVKK